MGHICINKVTIQVVGTPTKKRVHREFLIQVQFHLYVYSSLYAKYFVFTIVFIVLLTHAETAREKMLRLKINKFTYILFNVVS